MINMSWVGKNLRENVMLTLGQKFAIQLNKWGIIKWLRKIWEENFKFTKFHGKWLKNESEIGSEQS